MWAAMAKIFGGVIGVGLILFGCTEPPATPGPASDNRIGSIVSYVYEPDPQEYLAAPQLFPLTPEMSPAEALTALGSHLSRNYFNSDTGTGAPSIRFEVLAVHGLPVPHRTYRLAVINMIDPQLEALQGFFQGSAGGQTTFYMLTATFLQPHLEPPLADGLILLYNGEEFPAFDHINFRGIVTPETIRPVVDNVLYRNRRQAPAVTGCLGIEFVPRGPHGRCLGMVRSGLKASAGSKSGIPLPPSKGRDCFTPIARGDARACS